MLIFTGAGVDKSLDYLSYPTSKQPLRETNNVAGLQPIPLTGNAAADADIIAFYKARAGVLKKVSWLLLIEVFLSVRFLLKFKRRVLSKGLVVSFIMLF